MAPISDHAFESLRERVIDVERKLAVREEGNKAVLDRLGKIEGAISRVTWIVIGAIVSATMAFILSGGLNAPLG